MAEDLSFFSVRSAAVPESAVEIRDLRRSYTATRGVFRQHKVVREALRGISFDVHEGELFGLLGPNGAGKTTLVKIVATVLLPTAGSVRVLGADVVRDSDRVRRHIGLVFGGERGLYWSLSGRETLQFWGTMYGLPPSTLSARVDEMLDVIGLRDRAEDRVETYSRGMKQRLHLARGLLARPRLLLLDEPTIGLDPVAANEIREIVKRLHAQGTTIFLTTHYMAEAEALCDRVAFINDGLIVLLDRPAALTRAAAGAAQVEASIPGAALQSLQTEIAELSEAELALGETTASTVIVRIRASPSSVSRVIELLGRFGATRVTMPEPTLEDVYLRLLGDRGLRV